MKFTRRLLLVVSAVHIALRLVPISREAIPGVSGIWAANMFAQELSAWFVLLNLIGLVLSVRRRPLGVFFCAATLFSLLPFLQIREVNRVMARQWTEAGMGSYLLAPPGAVEVFAESFRLSEPEQKGQNLSLSLPMLYYSPRTRVPGKAYIVIDIHGGSWQHGSPQQDEALSRYLAESGYAVFAIDYRRAPAYVHPAHLNDVRDAITWVESNAGRFRADPTRIALVGHSAGGHLALLAAYTQLDPAIRSVVSFYGPTDLQELHQHPSSPDPLNVPEKLEVMMGLRFGNNQQAFRDASPIRYVRPGLPPTLQIQGSRDHIVPEQITRSMHEELRRAGNRALLLELPWSEHSFDMLWFGPGNRLARYYMSAFLAETLR